MFDKPEAYHRWDFKVPLYMEKNSLKMCLKMFRFKKRIILGIIIGGDTDDWGKSLILSWVYK